MLAQVSFRVFVPGAWMLAGGLFLSIPESALAQKSADVEPSPIPIVKHNDINKCASLEGVI